MSTQTIPNGTKVRANIPYIEGLHGREGVVDSFNPNAINTVGRNTGIYGVLMDNVPYFLYETEMEIVEEPKKSAEALRNEALNYVVGLLAEAQQDVKDTTAILAQQKERVGTLTTLADLLAEN